MAAVITMAGVILLPPSRFCGPFQEFSEFSGPFSSFINNVEMRPELAKAWSFCTSKPVIYTALVVIFKFIYFYKVQSSALSEKITILEQQLKKDEKGFR